jgi:succinate dehydrogenase/fumarate reductase cytochrome b subunit
MGILSLIFAWFLSNRVFLLAVLAGLAALVAVYYWYRAAAVPVKPSWEYDSSLKPKNFQQHAFGMVNALDFQQFWAGYYNKRAAVWTGISVVLTLLSIIAAWIG